ncbi:MAG: hypothetical protein QOH51_185 [Acidobacteriota bacterium]|jgi:integrase|nr:hypothetical protein [Acidobacteriota bacterium]
MGVVEDRARRSLSRRRIAPDHAHDAPPCLTDLARAGWDIHEIACFAGHINPQTTLLYIHLSGRDLAHKLAGGMTAIHAWRARMAAEVLG